MKGYGKILYAMIYESERGGYVQYTMDGLRVLDGVAIFKIKKRHGISTPTANQKLTIRYEGN